jgi:hypothetical protein
MACLTEACLVYFIGEKIFFFLEEEGPSRDPVSMGNDANDQAEVVERAAETGSTEDEQIWEIRQTKSDPIGGHLAEAEAQLAEDEPAECDLDQPMLSKPLQDYLGEGQPVKDCEMSDRGITVKPMENEEEIKVSTHESERIPSEAVEERSKEFSSSGKRTAAAVNGSASTGNGSAPTGNGPVTTGNGPAAAGNEREDEESRMEDDSESMASLETTYTSLRDNGVEPTLQFRLIGVFFLLFQSLVGNHSFSNGFRFVLPNLELGLLLILDFLTGTFFLS